MAALLAFLVASCNAAEDAGQEMVSADNSAVAEVTAKPEAAPEPAPVENPEPESLIAEMLPEQLQILTQPWFGDLDGMAKRRIIRVLVVSGGPQYFYYKGKPRGIVAELLQMFQVELNKKLGMGLNGVEVLPMPVSRDRLFGELVAGHADLIAADLTITKERDLIPVQPRF